MSKLPCSIVSYRPDPHALSEKFRIWQVETHLKQGCALIDRCLADFSNYCSLDFAWNEFEADLQHREKQLDLDTRRQGGWNDEETEAAPEEVQAGAAEEAPETAAEPTEAEELAGAADLSEEEPAPAAPAVEAPKTRLELRVEAVQRTKELAAPGRPFALNEQRDLALKRVCRDYEEAVDRALVAEEGLSRLFGYLPESRALPYEAETLGSSITNLAIWLRDAEEWLVRYHQQEQEFSRVVSLRALLNRNAWTNLRHARDSFATKLHLPMELFRGHDNCRLLGLSAWLVGEAGTVPWSLTIRLPDEAIYERAGQNGEIDQRSLPPCHLGRVQNNRAGRNPEPCGTVSHLNASPLGRPTPEGAWSFELVKPIGAANESFTHIEDLILELRLAGKPR